MNTSIYEDCEKEARMFEEDDTGYCFKHVISYAEEELREELKEEITGITRFEVSQRALEKGISFIEAEKELIKKKDD